MATIETLSLWDQAIQCIEKNEFQEALEQLQKVSQPSAKILFNIGSVYLMLQQPKIAVRNLEEAIQKDEHLAIAYFQRGTAHFRNNQYDDALADFKESYKRLRDKRTIDYSQLGLRYKFYACECLFNIGVCHAWCRNDTKALDYIQEAIDTKQESRHKTFEEAVKKIQNGSLPNTIELPKEAVFRPAKSKIISIQPKDFLGKSKVVSSLVQGDKFSGFAGPKLRDEGKLSLNEVKSAPTSPNSSPVPRRRKFSVDTSQLAFAKLFKVLGSNPAVDNLKVAEGKLNVKSKSNPSSPVGDRKKSIPGVPWKPTKAAPPTCPPPNRPAPRSSSLPKVVIDDGETEAQTNKRHGKNLFDLPKVPLKPWKGGNKVTQSSGPPPSLPQKKLPGSPDIVPPKPPIKPRQKTVPANTVTIQFFCNESIKVESELGTKLSDLNELACEQYQFQNGSIDLWFKNQEDKELYPITDEAMMQNVWSEVKASGTLQLWCYGKS